MDAAKFDAFVRSVGLGVPRRSAVAGTLGAGIAVLVAILGVDQAAARKKRKKKKCKGTKKKCGQKCIPKEECCQSADCGENEKCSAGACVPCLSQGTDCTEDAQCCTGICDTYTNKCQQVRVECADGESCPGGRCCNVFGPQCLYTTATQGTCVPDGLPNASCGFLLCGDKCSDLENGTYQFCGNDGSAACRNGRCCCPKGIPLEECPNLQGEGNLPRC